MARLAEARNLQSLALDGRQLTEFSVAALARRRSLIELYLYGRNVDASVIELAARLPRLIELNLLGVALDGAAIPAIAKLPHLRVVRVVGALPRDFAEALQAACPALLIEAANETPLWMERSAGNNLLSRGSRASL